MTRTEMRRGSGRVGEPEVCSHLIISPEDFDGCAASVEEVYAKGWEGGIDTYKQTLREASSFYSLGTCAFPCVLQAECL
jgi:hypothetical protein